MIYGVVLGVLAGICRRHLRQHPDAHRRCHRGIPVPGPDHRHRRDPRSWRSEHLSSPSSSPPGPCMRGWPAPRCWSNATRTTSWRRAPSATARSASSSATRLPNVINSSIVFSMSDFVLNIMLVSGLSFLGLGVSPPTPEWGAMIAEGRDFIFEAWWISTLPGLATRGDRHGALPHRRRYWPSAWASAATPCCRPMASAVETLPQNRPADRHRCRLARGQRPGRRVPPGRKKPARRQSCVAVGPPGRDPGYRRRIRQRQIGPLPHHPAAAALAAGFHPLRQRAFRGRRPAGAVGRATCGRFAAPTSPWCSRTR